MENGGGFNLRRKCQHFFQEQDRCSAVLQPFCGNSAERIFCLQDSICSQDRFWHLIVFPRLKSCSAEILQSRFFAGQQNRQILAFDNLARKQRELEAPSLSVISTHMGAQHPSYVICISAYFDTAFINCSVWPIICACSSP